MTLARQKTSTLLPQIVSSIGIILSLYALYVEKRHHEEEEQTLMVEEPFKALCDIEAIGASCSAVFAMPEGKMLSFFKIVPSGSWMDVPNAALGLIYYLTVLTLSKALPTPIIFSMSICAMSASVFLAIRLVQLNELCILCWTTHVINTTLLVHFGKRVWTEGKNDEKKAKSS